ncbi:DMT family transporter [Bosea sp. PAMC 26642]|uniref:DMT family transporter n=1 Tax=Bosea sp. (strain PAMC 26642) TaxID=1792307 RepID=UPI000AFA54FF|nr:DMT family transporter [Bosea sp. PAMC 26642]
MPPTQTLPQRAWANPYLLLALTMLMWSGNAVASRLAVGNISPMTMTALRWGGVCLVLPLLLRGQIAEHAPSLRRRWCYIALMGVCGFTMFNAFLYLAGYSTTAINIGILQGSIPIFVLIGAFLAFRTPIAPLQALGVAVTMVGIAVTASRGDIHVLAGLSFATGDVYIILASILYAGYTVAIRKRPAIPALVFFTAAAFAAFVGSLPLLAIEIATGNAFWPTPKGLLVLVFVVLGPSMVAQLSFLRAVELIGPGRAGVFANLVPVFTPIMAVLIIGEQLALYHGVALLLVLGGIFIAERLGRR